MNTIQKIVAALETTKAWAMRNKYIALTACGVALWVLGRIHVPF